MGLSSSTRVTYSEVEKGSTFKVYLPLIKSEVKRSKVEIKTATKGGTETILVAEDKEDVRILIKIALEGHGYTVDGRNAIDKFRENKDAIPFRLLDAIMPDKNDREAYDAIKEMKPAIKAIFMSDYNKDVKQEDIFKVGLYFISKPVLPTELLKSLREALDR